MVYLRFQTDAHSEEISYAVLLESRQMLNVTPVIDCASCQTISLEQWSFLSDFNVECFAQKSCWLHNAWEEFHRHQCGVNSDSLCCLQVSNGNGDSIGKSAWFRQFSRGIVWWRLVGSGAVCSDYVQLPCHPGQEIEVAQATAKWFAIQPRRFVEAPVAIEVDGHRSNCPQWLAFFETLVDRGWTRDSVNVGAAWRVQLPETWKAYDATLSKSRRRKARRAVKMLERGELDYRLLVTPDQIEQNWAEFVRLHQMRRIQLGQRGCFHESYFDNFLKSAAKDLASQQSAFIAQLYFEDKPLAMLLIFCTASTWFVYQSGFDTDRSELEPGHLVHGLTLKTAIETGIQQLDYLRGDEDYKSGWKSIPQPLSRTILLPPGIASRGISSALKIKRNLQSWLKKASASSVRREELSSDD